jgi:hypothetical protein
VTVSLDTIYARSERMVGRRIADEFVLVPLARSGAEIDSLYNLSPVAAFIWELLDGKVSGVTVVQGLLQRYDVGRDQAERDYVELLEQLQSIGAVSALTIDAPPR